MKREDKVNEMDGIDRDLKELTDRVDKVLDETERKFARCPKCGLPTHLGQDRRKAFCANCNMYYDVSEKSSGKKKLKKRNRKVPIKATIIFGVFAVIFLILVSSLGYYLFHIESDPGLIDIQDVNEIRKLPIANDVPMKTMTSSQLEIYIQESIDDDARREIRNDEALYKFLFIIPDYWDLVDIYENESSGGGIAGMYDTELEEMYVIGEGHSRNYINSILSHEYTHALQDQNFDLDSIYPADTFDSNLAMLCSIEGDAMRTMGKWEDSNLEEWEKALLDIESLMQAMSTLDLEGEYYSSPVLSELMYFPYKEGLEFVKMVYGEGGMDAVNDLFTERPAISTEQIMHFNKYLEYERPKNVTFNGDTSGLDLQFKTTVGEKILKEAIGDTAMGWGGDSFYHYTSSDSFLSVLVTEWDTPEENIGFASDYENMLEFNGWKNGDVYSIGGNYAYMRVDGGGTSIFYSDSMAIIDRFS